MSSDKIKGERLDNQLRVLQMILLFLIGGVAGFMFILYVMLGARVQPFDPKAIISMVMAGLAVVALFARMILPGMIVQANVRRIATGSVAAGQPSPDQKELSTEVQLLGVFFMKTIIGGALLEGAAFANLVAFMLEGQVYSILLVAVLLASMTIAFPTRGGLNDWLEDQARRINEARLFSK